MLERTNLFTNVNDQLSGRRQGVPRVSDSPRKGHFGVNSLTCVGFFVVVVFTQIVVHLRIWIFFLTLLYCTYRNFATHV